MAAITNIANVSNISALSTGTTLIGSLTNLLIASPQQTQGYQPANPPGPTGLLSLFSPPPSLVFHYEGEQTATLSSDITDHFIEDNTSIQDQVALKPVIITTHGFIGELNNVPPRALQLLQQAANTLTTIGAYVPGVSPTALLAYNEAFAAYQFASNAINAGVSAVSSLFGQGGESVIGSQGITTNVANQNNQQTYFQQLYGYWYNRTFFTVQTPWAIFQNMVILNLRAVQDAETRVITDFELSFKQINIASTALGSSLQSIGQAATQSAPNTNLGTNALNPAGPSVQSGVVTQTGSP